MMPDSVESERKYKCFHPPHSSRAKITRKRFGIARILNVRIFLLEHVIITSSALIRSREVKAKAVSPFSTENALFTYKPSKH